MEFRYFDIQKDGKDWIAWFLLPVDEKALILEQISGKS